MISDLVLSLYAEITFGEEQELDWKKRVYDIYVLCLNVYLPVCVCLHICIYVCIHSYSIIHSFINLYSAPSRGLFKGAADSSTSKKVQFLSLIKNASSRVPERRRSSWGRSFQTTGPTTEKAWFCIVAVRANGTKSTPFSAERRGDDLEYPRGNKALAGSLGRGPADIVAPRQQSCTQYAAGYGVSLKSPAYSWRHDQIVD